MKKSLILAVAAVLFLASCSPKDKNENTADKLPPVQNLDEIYQWDIPLESRPEIPIPIKLGNGGGANPEQSKGNLEKIEILTGREKEYMATFSTADGGKQSVINTYEFISAKAVGDVYILNGIGKLTVTENGFKLELLDQQSIEVEAQSAKPLDLDEALGDFARAWKVQKTFLTVKASGLSGNLGAGVEYEGCDVNAIVKALNDDGLKIDFSKPGYKVNKIYLSPFGTFAIYFDNGEVFAGTFQINGLNFSYDLDVYDNDNPIISGKASGSIKMVKSKCNLDVNADFTDNASKEYSVVLKFILEIA